MLALCRQSTAFAHSPIPSLSSLNSSSTPVLRVSPSHNPPFAPSNYNSIHQSFAVTMATAMLGTGPRVARGHQSATDHHHLLHQIELQQYFLHGLWTSRGTTLWEPKNRFLLRHFVLVSLKVRGDFLLFLSSLFLSMLLKKDLEKPPIIQYRGELNYSYCKMDRSNHLQSTLHTDMATHQFSLLDSEPLRRIH